jgi:hypothetical protein
MLNARPAQKSYDIYEPRNPRKTHYFQCVQNHFEDLEMLWDDRYERQYGFFRPYVRDVIYRYLDCGDLHLGFARVRCLDCGHEYLLPFSCKRRHFCPSCHQKRVVEFGEWLCEEVLKYVPHRQWVFSIPKRLRVYFMTNRRLLSRLSQCAWKVLSTYLKAGVPYDDAVLGCVIAVQSFGDFQNFNPHLHIIATDGCFYGTGMFIKGPTPASNDLEDAFRREVFALLKKEGMINDFIIENMMNWHHSGFNVYCGKTLWPDNDEGLENLARYIIRASFSSERMMYIPASETKSGAAKVIYESKSDTSSKTFEALDWLAQLTTHIPNRGEQMVRYYGFYSNKMRGMRRKAGEDNAVPALMESVLTSRAFRKNWARLIQKIYHVDPLLCPKCQGTMKIISFIEEPDVIRKILVYLDLWDIRNHAPPPKKYVQIPELTFDDSYSQLPFADAWIQ